MTRTTADIFTVEQRREIVAALKREIAGFEGASRRKGVECCILPGLRRALADARERLAVAEAHQC